MSGRGWRSIGWAFLVSGLLILGIWGTGVYRTARLLVRDADEIQALLSQPDTVDPVALQARLRALREEVDSFQDQVGSLPSLLGPSLGWVPQFGPLLKASPHLLELADSLSGLALGVSDDLVAAREALNRGEPLPAVLSRTASDLQPRIPMLEAALERAQKAYAQIDIARLPSRLSVPLERLGQAMPVLEQGLRWIELTPRLLGLDLPRTYLILLLNEDELRPGGGFITAVARVRVAHGVVVDIDVEDSYAVDDYAHPYPEPPDPLRQFLGIDLWVFRDSNWSPDFRTSCAAALSLYRPTDPAQVDGLIALDQMAVRRLLDTIGPLAVPGTASPLDGQGVFELIHATWAPADGVFDREWWLQRKAILEPLALAALRQIQGGAVDWRRIASEALALTRARHIQVCSTDAETQLLLSEAGLDGAVRQSAGDFLMVVEANVGFNKASGMIDRRYAYSVDLSNAVPTATVVLTYTHMGSSDIACLPEAAYGAEYADMKERCYWAYLRLLASPGASLLGGSRHPIAAAQIASQISWPGDPVHLMPREAGKEQFAQAFLIPPAGQVVVRFEFSLPPIVLYRMPDGSEQYHLLWQKQPGTGPIPVLVTLRMPPNAVLSSAPPQARLEGEGLLVYEATLDADLELDLRYVTPKGARPQE